MAKLDLEWLAVFQGIYKTRSVSRAAEELGIAQATASIALNKLRLHFGDKLFIRTSGGMEPTARAQALQPQLTNVLAILEQASGAPPAFVAADACRTFRICMTDISEIVILPGLVNHLRQVAPGIRVEAEKITPDSPKRLEAGEVDLAVGFMPHLEAGFFQQALFTQSYVCLAAMSHPRVRTRLTRNAFSAESHVVVTTPGTGHSIVDKVLAQQHIERQVVLRLTSFLGVARVVAQTELLVIVPQLLGKTLASQEQIRVLELPFDLPSYSVKQHWHERFHADPANIWLRRTMADLYGTPTARRA